MRFPALLAGLIVIATAGCKSSGNSGNNNDNQNNAARCGNDTVEGAEECDGTDLGGEDCARLGLQGGTLACGADCTYDTSGCTGAAVCGNDAREFPEECDGADLAGEDCTSLGFGGGTLACTGGCAFDTSNCQVIPVCGNDTREAPEQCDGADLGGQDCAGLGLGSGTLSCATDCTYDLSGCSIQPQCGNDSTEFPEICDGTDLNSEDCVTQGFYTGTLACAADCSGYDTSGCSGMCGDQAINGPEACDGSDLGGEDCPTQGFYTGTLVCLADCSALDNSGCSGSCGDGTIDAAFGEGCDDGPNNSDTVVDACRLSCQPAGCGDGIIDTGETCDDGANNSDTTPDACRTTCLPASCGDGTVDTGEGCDNGALNSDTQPGACRTGCIPAGCGDGVVDFVLAEQCDDGNTTSGDGCDPSCQIENPGLCGDGNIDPGESCDDGNTWSGDGCSSNCQIEPQVCGDGNVDIGLGEQCDDGNLLNGDGCSDTCQIEQPPTCGDGNLDIATGEQCDDGNTTSGDGCSDTCQFEQVGATCGDATVDPLEVCDDGNTTGGDACNPTCNLTNTTTAFVGQPGVQGSLDATGTQATIGGFGTLTADDAFLYYADGNNRVIRRIEIATSVVTTIAGNAAAAPLHIDDPIGTNARFLWIESVATDGATLWVLSGCTIREVQLIPPYAVTTVAGTPGGCGAIVDGTGPAAVFDDHRGLVYYQGLLYLLDSVAAVVRRYDPGNQNVITVAGQAYSLGVADGFGLNAQFISPRYQASNNSGLLYIADTNGNTIREYNTVTTEVRTFAGDGTPGYLDGVGTAAQIHRPRGMTSDGTSIYWSEFNAHTIRQGELATRVVSTLVGTPLTPGYLEGTGTAALLDSPVGLVFHYPTNSLFFVDGANFLIRRIQ